MFSLKKNISKAFIAVIIVFSGYNLVAQNINTPNKVGPLGAQVNTFSGNLYIPRTDLYIPARGFDLSISFYYNSYYFDQNFGFGNGWSFGYSIKYSSDTANNKTITWGDGREDVYTQFPGGIFNPPTGFFDTLSQYQPGKYLLSELDGTKYYFDNSTTKRITKMLEPNGNYISFNYADTVLTSVVNNEGQTISFTHDGAGRMTSMVDAITSPTRTWIYSYDGGGNLKQVTDPLGGSNKYSYLVNGPMKTMSDKNSNTVDIIYYGDYSVSEVIGCNKRQSYSYDTTARITVATDYVPTASNQVTTYGYKVYNGQVWLTSLTSNCCGYNMKFEFDNNGNKTKQTDANGNITTYTYDSKGNLITLTDPLNRTTAFTYLNSFDNINSVTDPKGNVTTLAYNSTGNLTQLTSPGNLIYTATYNSNGDILSSTDPNGNTYTYSYDAYGNPVSVSGPNGYHATLGFDARGHLLSYTDARGNTGGLEYDILDRLKKITDPINNSVQITYDAEGNATTFKNENTETSQLKYDASNRPVEVTDALNNKRFITYDAMDNTITEKNALGNSMNYQYDTKNRLSSVTDALGNVGNLSYDANGNIIAISLPTGAQLSYTYDPSNRVTSVQDNSGTISSLAYDKNNNITSYTNGTGAAITASYDNLNRVTKLTDPLGNSFSVTYDDNSNISTVTDRNGFVKTYTYDGLNRVKTYADNNGFITTPGYDAQGNVISIKDQNNNITGYIYDSLNRLTTTTYPDGKFKQYTYDKKGNIVTKRLTDGTIISFVYDALNRITSRILPNGNVNTYTYDALSRVTAATNNAGSVNITYDELNRVASETFDGRTIYYSYNIAGRTQTIIYPDSTTITKTFDIRNRLTNIAKGSTPVVSYQYNNANQVIAENFANGISSNMQYDFANRLSNLSTAGGSIQNSNFTYDKEMNKTAIDRQNNTSLSEQFTYDNQHRIINYKRGTAGSPTIQNTYSFDAVGNRTGANLNGTNITYTPNNLNQLTSSNGGSQNINFTYDNNGNLTYDGTFYKSYDAEGRLIKDSATSSRMITYQYDALGRRVQKALNGVPYKYTFSGLSQIEERDGITNALLNRTVYNNFITPVVNEKNGNQYFYHQNELNSVEAITNSAGTLTERYQYDIYGKPTIYDNSNNIIPSSLAGNRFGFTGQEYDTAGSSYHFRFRNYSPSTGTFNQRDPLGYGDGTGMYQYVHDNPANGIDVFGLDDCGGHATTSTTSMVDYTDQAQWWSGQFSNVGSFLQVYQSTTTKTMMITKSVQFFGQTGTYLAEVQQHGLLGNLSTAANCPFLSVAMVPFNIANTITPAMDMYYNGSEMSGGDRFNNGTSIVSSGATTGVGLYGLSGGSLTASGLATAPVAFAGVALAGGLAIEGGLDAAYEKATGYVNGTGKGDHFTDVGRNNDIPFFTSAVSWMYSGPMFEHDAFGRRGTERTDDNMSWQYSDTYRNARNRTNNRVGHPHTGTINGWKPRIINCPQNNDPHGPRYRKYWFFLPNGDSVEVVQSKDPNVMIGPDGSPNKHWVSVNDRLPYTILYENAKSASAPAKFVRITTPIEPKEDAATFQLGSFGFNSLTFNVQPGTASYYQRLDAKDSLGLYVDVTAGYDQIANLAFWEFQAIDPTTLLPPSDPLKGFLLLQDSAKQLNGHGFVNFSIKPKTTDITLDTIGARASVVFDGNDTIPTNIFTNTIDAFAPTSHMTALPATSNNPVALSWNGVDDPGGCGVKYYTLYVSIDGTNFNIIRSGITRRDTTFTGAPNTTYYFFVLATDSVGNTETMRLGEIRSTYIGFGPLPVTWLYFTGKTVVKDNVLDWATTNEQGTRLFDVERSLNSTTFSQVGVVQATGSSQTNTYQYTDQHIDRLNSETMYYRLKQVDINGNYKYSNIVRLTYKTNGGVKSIVYPNPTQALVTIVIGDNALIGTTAVLADINGRFLENIKITTNNQPVNLSKYVNGTYFIRLSNKEVLKIIKE